MTTRGGRSCSQLLIALTAAACTAQPVQKASPRQPVAPDSYVIADLVAAERFLVSTDTRVFVEAVPGKRTNVRLVADSAGCRLELVIGGLLGGGVQSIYFAEDAEWVSDPTSKLRTQGGKIVLGGDQSILVEDWFDGAEHTFRGDVRLGSYVFMSDRDFPLTFQVVKGKGYVYLSGRGAVQKDGAQAVGLGKDQVASDWLARLTGGTALEKHGAAIALGWYRDRAAVPALLAAAKDTTSWRLRRDAAEALGRIGDPAAVDVLGAAIADENGWVGAVALEALARIGKPGLPAIEKSLAGEERVRKLAIYALGFSPADEALGLLAKAAASSSADVRKTAVRALGRTGKPAAAATLLAALASDTDNAVRTAAVGALSRVQTPACAEAVLGAARDKVTDVRRAAIDALGRSTDPRAAAVLEEMAARDADKDLRDAARKAVETRKAANAAASASAAASEPALAGPLPAATPAAPSPAPPPPSAGGANLPAPWGGASAPRSPQAPAAQAPRQPAPSPTAPLSTRVVLAPARLQLIVVPWAEVDVDGKGYGQTPFAPLSLSAGEHTLTLTHPEYEPLRRRLALEAGATFRLRVDLAREGVRKNK